MPSAKLSKQAKRQLVDRASRQVIVADLEVANTFWKRFIGLQFRKHLASDSGLLLSPCSSIHTCWMRFAIDLIMLDREGRVVGTRTALKPWRICLCPRGTVSIVEIPAGELRVTVGRMVEIV